MLVPFVLVKDNLVLNFLSSEDDNEEVVIMRVNLGVVLVGSDLRLFVKKFWWSVQDIFEVMMFLCLVF